MSITLSKTYYGTVVGPDAGITVSKVMYGVIVGPDPGIDVIKVYFGIIVDTLTPEPTSGRRRNACLIAG